MNRRQLLAYGAFGLGAMALPPGLVWGRPHAAQPQVDLSEIERIVFHPAIGIARVGNSPDAWFLGPETPGPHPMPADGFKDAAGRIKPQAARFRLYGLDGDGQVVAEVTADNADIRWTVHLANTKAAWYNFDIALDIPQAKGLPAAPLQAASDPTSSSRRNQAFTDRASLRIDPGPRSVDGANVNADGADVQARFDSGRFLDMDVPLGELRTDEREPGRYRRPARRTEAKGAMLQRPFCSSPRSAAKQAAESKRGRHSQSMEPSRPMRATDSVSPKIA